jgi:hypothetical protein
MRKLLQSKAAVAVIAMLCIGGNFVKWPTTGALPVVARTSAGAAAVNSAEYPIRTPLQIERTLADWRGQWADLRPGRDPFSPVRGVIPASTNTASTPAPGPPPFLVQAISIEADKAFAVINRQVLTTGEQIDGYVLEQIQPTLVRLRGPAGAIAVPVGPAARQPKTASAK